MGHRGTYARLRATLPRVLVLLALLAVSVAGIAPGTVDASADRPAPALANPAASPAASSAVSAPAIMEVASESVPAKRLRIAVMDLSLAGDDVPARTGRIVADNLVAELRKLQNVTVVSMDELRAMLAAEATRQELGCSAEQSCLAEITDALGADVLVVGGIASFDDARVLSLRRLDQGSATASQQVDERLVIAGGEELLAAVGPAVAKLFPEVALRSGQVRGVPPEIARRLNPPPLPVWSTLAVGGLGVAALAGGVAFGIAAASEGEALQSSIDASGVTPLQATFVVERQARVDQLALAANVLYACATVSAVGGLGMALVTDWQNAAAAE